MRLVSNGPNRMRPPEIVRFLKPTTNYALSRSQLALQMEFLPNAFAIRPQWAET